MDLARAVREALREDGMAIIGGNDATDGIVTYVQYNNDLFSLWVFGENIEFRMVKYKGTNAINELPRQIPLADPRAIEKLVEAIKTWK